MLEHALRLLERGFAVFPLQHKKKIPYAKSKGFVEASTSPELARGVWTTRPSSNIGIATGKPSGIVVLDIDGAEGYQFLESRGYEIPETLTVITGKGKQYYFKAPEAEMNNRASMGGKETKVDFRGDGGYVVAPPSIHPSGAVYEFEDWDTEVADCPQWLIDLHKEVNKSTGSSVAEEVMNGAPIADGARNATLTSVAGRLRQQGEGFNFILNYIRGINLSQCEPPLEDAELHKISESVCRYEPQTLTVSEAEKVFEMMEQVNVEQAKTTEQTKKAKKGLELELIRRTHGAGRRAQFIAVIYYNGRKAVLDGITGANLLAFPTIRALAVEEGMFLPNSKVVVRQWGEIVQNALDSATVEKRDADEDCVGACMVSIQRWVNDLGEAGSPEDVTIDPEGVKFRHERGWAVSDAALRRHVKLVVPDAARDDVSKAMRIMKCTSVTISAHPFRYIPDGSNTISEHNNQEEKEELHS